MPTNTSFATRLRLPIIATMIMIAASAGSQTPQVGDKSRASAAADGNASLKRSKIEKLRARKPGEAASKILLPMMDGAAKMVPSTLAGAAAKGAPASPQDLAAKLIQAGADVCAAAIDLDAAPSMIGVTQSNTLTTWSNVEPHNQRMASVFIGQQYGTNPAVPYGVTGVIASPNPSGTCDSTVVQIVSSPLPCTNVRENLLRGGKPGGDLAGVNLVVANEEQTLLMPTANNTCVLVGIRQTFRGR